MHFSSKKCNEYIINQWFINASYSFYENKNLTLPMTRPNTIYCLYTILSKHIIACTQYCLHTQYCLYPIYPIHNFASTQYCVLSINNNAHRQYCLYTILPIHNIAHTQHNIAYAQYCLYTLMLIDNIVRTQTCI